MGKSAVISALLGSLAVFALATGDSNVDVPSSSTAKIVTTNAPTTTVIPIPTPPSAANLYNLTNEQGKYCVLFKAIVRFNFVYKKVDHPTENATGHAYLPSIEDGTIVSGSCNKSSNNHIMNLTFFDNWTLELSFTKNLTTNKYSMDDMKLSYAFKQGALPFPDAATTQKKEVDIRVDDGAIGDLSSYICLSRRTLMPGDQKEVGLTGLDVADEEYEAFVHLDEVFFSRSRVRCKADNISNLIPIIVGASLAVLIVVVIVAYFIGRHRSRRGYESV